jgi:hypothetical protein
VLVDGIIEDRIIDSLGARRWFEGQVTLEGLRLDLIKLVATVMQARFRSSLPSCINGGHGRVA